MGRRTIGVTVAAVALTLAGLVASLALAATDPSGCVLHQGNHCKAQTTATTGTTGTTTTVATTTDTTPTTTETVPTTTTTQTTPQGSFVDHGVPWALDPHSVASGTCVTSGSDVACHNKEWNCTGPVQLHSVNVLIDSSGDAIKLGGGSQPCSGSIGQLNCEQHAGDCVHITFAQDLVIGTPGDAFGQGGTLRCYQHVPLKHQDGLQVMGGQRVTIYGLDVGCFSANNSQVWINQGAGGNGPGGVPTDVVFNGDRFQGYYNGGEYGPGGSYGFSDGSSVRTGLLNSVVCPNAHTQRQLNLGSAQQPVGIAAQDTPAAGSGNLLPSSC